MAYKTLDFTMEERIGVLTFNRDKKNFLNPLMLNELNSFLRNFPRIDADRKEGVPHALIVTGNQNGFVPGLDLTAFDPEDKFYLESLNNGRDAMRMIEQLQIPTLAAVNKYAIGGGLEIALSCDFIFADEGAKLGFPEVKYGLIPGAGGTVLLPQRVGIAKAKELIYSGRLIDAETARVYGLVDAITEPEYLLPRAKEFLGTMIQNPSAGIARAKHSINVGDYETERRAFEDALANPQVKETIRNLLTREK